MTFVPPLNLPITSITSSMLVGVETPASLCHMSRHRAYIQPPVKVTLVPVLQPEDTSLGYYGEFEASLIYTEFLHQVMHSPRPQPGSAPGVTVSAPCPVALDLEKGGHKRSSESQCWHQNHP